MFRWFPPARRRIASTQVICRGFERAPATADCADRPARRALLLVCLLPAWWAPPVLAQPSNDDINNAITVDCGSSVMGTTVGAAVDMPGGQTTCGTAITSGGVWYAVSTPAGQSAVTLSTCNQAAYDSKISVFNGSTAAPNCLGGNDDGAGCAGFTSEVTVTSSGPETLYVLVHGFGGATGTFTLDVTCTPVVVDNGRIEVIKDANPPSSQAFQFNATAPLGNFTLTDDGSSTTDSAEFTGLAAGTYTISEVVPTGWELDDVSCVDAVIRSEVPVVRGSNDVQVQLGADDDIVCTFRNEDIRTDLELTKTVVSTNHEGGGTVTYEIVATNAGPGDALNTIVQDQLPSAFDDATWTCIGAGGGLCTNDTANETGIGDLDEMVDLPAGASVTFMIEGTLQRTFYGDLLNVATLMAASGVIDTSSGNDTGEASVFVEPDVLAIPVTGRSGALLLMGLLSVCGLLWLRRTLT